MKVLRTVIDVWRETHPETDKDSRIALWQDLVRGRKMWPLPWDWADRIAGWKVGAIFDVGHSLRLAHHMQPGRPPDGHTPNVSADGVACVVPDRTGHRWAFSHRAVLQAYLAWNYWNLGFYGQCPRMGWLSTLRETNAILPYRVASPIMGWDALEAEGKTVLFHSSVIGPVGAWSEESGWMPSPQLAIEQEGEKIRVRGAMVPEGLWQNNRVEPILAEGGWFHL